MALYHDMGMSAETQSKAGDFRVVGQYASSYLYERQNKQRL